MTGSDKDRDKDEAPRGFGVPSVDLLAQFWNDPLDYRLQSGDPPRRTVGSASLALVTVMIIGLLLSVAYKETVAAEPANAEARQDLRAEIELQREANAGTEEQAEGLRDEVNQLRDALIGGEATVTQLHEAEAAAGLRAVTGDGVTTTVTDGPSPSDPANPDLGTVYDRDLQLVVNALWAYGAEAVAIDDQRLTATSSIRAAGDAILVDFSPVNSPYEITAIGPGDMADKLRDSATAETFDEYATRYGITMTVTDSSDLELPAAAPPPLENASPKETN